MSSKNDAGHSQDLGKGENIEKQICDIEGLTKFYGKRVSFTFSNKRNFEDRIINSLYIEELLERSLLTPFEMEIIRSFIKGETISKDEKSSTKKNAISAPEALKSAIVKIRKYVYFTEVVLPILCKHYQEFSVYFDELSAEQKYMFRIFPPQNPDMDLLKKRSSKGQKGIIDVLISGFEILTKCYPACLEEYDEALKESGFSYQKQYSIK